MLNKIIICTLTVVFGVMTAGVLLSYADDKSYTQEELGLRKEPLSDESATVPAHGEPIKKEPGESARIERAFENSPPVIPHDITGMLPLKLPDSDNACLECHMPKEAVSMGATAIPKSHFTDFDTGKDLDGKLDGGRYNCMQCHVVQTKITPAVRNLFKGEFRNKDGRYRSNLMDVINEGVEAE
jgi:cytochrome c-type protein NapB